MIELFEKFTNTIECQVNLFLPIHINGFVVVFPCPKQSAFFSCHLLTQYSQHHGLTQIILQFRVNQILLLQYRSLEVSKYSYLVCIYIQLQWHSQRLLTSIYRVERCTTPTQTENYQWRQQAKRDNPRQQCKCNQRWFGTDSWSQCLFLTK